MNRSLIILVTACSFVAACSSGGKGNGGQAPPADLAITGANGMLVTKASYQAALATVGLGDLPSSTGLFGSDPGTQSKIDGSFATSNEIGRGTAQIPIPPTTDVCIPSGSITISGEIADPFTPTLTPNDFFDVDFDLCDDGFSVTDGSLHFVVAAFSGELLFGMYDLTMNTTVSNFQVATAEDVLTSNGDAAVRLDTSVADIVTIEVSGASLTIDKNSSSETQSDFSSSQTQDVGDIPSTYTMVSSGTLDSTQLTGVVQYSTPTMFEGLDADYPHAGVFLVTGGNNSSARLTVIDNVNVRIDIDSNGDGAVDDTINTTWAELDGGQAGIM